MDESIEGQASIDEVAMADIESLVPEEGNPPLKKRKVDEDEEIGTECNSSSSSPSPVGGSYFIMPVDFEHLTDYHILLFGQTKGGKMTQADLERSNRSSSAHTLGFPGMRCANCGGNERGSYFPSTTKNLHGCTISLHTHLLSCRDTSETVTRALKAAKGKHRLQSSSKPTGGISTFFTHLWSRIHSETFNGAEGSDRQFVADKLNALVEEYGSLKKKSKGGTSNITSLHKAIPNILPVVSYEDVLPWLPLVLLEQKNTNSMTGPQEGEYTEQDLKVALELLMQPTDNCLQVFENCPTVEIDPTPTFNAMFPGLSGEVVASGMMMMKQPAEATTNSNQTPKKHASSPKKRGPKSNKKDREEGKTRKFTREAEILLIRGMIKHGKNWAKIYDEQAGLHHIKQSALKDRARSQHFKRKLDTATLDHSLLDRIDELCGPTDQVMYTYDTLTLSTPSPSMLPSPSILISDLQDIYTDQCMTIQHTAI